MKKGTIIIMLLMICLSTIAQTEGTNTIIICSGKPWYPLNKKVIEQVSEELYFNTLDAFGKVIVEDLYFKVKDKFTDASFIIDTISLALDTLPFQLNKAGYLSPSNWKSDFFGKDAVPSFSLDGIPNGGFPKFFKNQKIFKKTNNQQTDIVLVIWPLMAQYSTSEGAPPFTGPNGSGTLIVYCLYNQRSGEILEIDYLKNEILWADADTYVAYQEMVESLVNKIEKKLFE